MGELKGNDAASRAPVAARGSRLILGLLACGLLLLLLGAGWFTWGLLWSGRLALAQPAPSTELPRGFDFGPVWLEQGASGRYFLRAEVPQTQGSPWFTSFEILDARKQPVLRQEDARYIGDYQFNPGRRATFIGAFRLAEQTGYYYFRFTARSGEYPARAEGPPVLELSLRQRVIAGAALWAPAIGSALLGLSLILLAFRIMAILGRRRQFSEFEDVAPAASAGRWGQARQGV